MAMGDVIARLSVSLGLQTAAFEKGATLAEKRMSQTQRKFEKMGRKIGDVGKTMSLAVTAPLVAFGVSSFNAASDAAELEAAFGQTFGKMTADMQNWAETTGDAMGRSTQEMQKAANTFGIFFNAAGATNEKAAEMSQTFSELAQDLGSFYNVDTDTAIQKLRSGLSGEAEPLRDFGVFLNEAAVKARAAEMGLTGLGDELTDQEKILARYSLIMEQTANAQGDVARTSDGTANQMRKAKAAFEELQVVVGTKLLPAITPLIEKLGGLIEWFTKLPDPVQEGTLVVLAISAALGPLLLVVVQLVSVFPMLMKAMTLLFAHPIILGAAVLIGGIYLAWKNWDKITAIVKSVYQGVKTWLMDKLGPIFNWVTDKVKKVEQGFAWLYDKVVGNSWIPDMVQEIGNHMAKLDALMVDPAVKAAQKTDDAFRELASSVSSIIDRLFPKMAALRDMREELATVEQGVAAGIVDPAFAQELNSRIRAEARGTGRAEPTAATVAAPAGIDWAATSIQLPPIINGIDKMIEKARELKRVIGEAASEAFAELGYQLKGVLHGAQSLGDALKNIAMRLADMAFNAAWSSLGASLKLPGFANGTRSAPSGWAWVGERGPELVRFSGGERVYNNRDSMDMARGPVNGGGVVVNQNVYTPDANSFRRSERQITRGMNRRLNQ